MKKFLLLIFIPALLSGCVFEKVNKLESENAQLKRELNAYRTSPSLLLKKMQIAFDSAEHNRCNDLFDTLKYYHPDKPEFEQAKLLLQKIKVEKQRELAKIEAEKQEKLSSLKKLRKEFDDVTGNTWYSNPYFTHYNGSYRTSIYIGENEEHKKVWLRLKMGYRGDGWIFFEHAYLSYDGNTMSIPFYEYDDKKSDHDGGKVWEWIDVLVDSDLEDFIREMVKSNTIKMRFSGKYTRTRTLNWKERQGIIDVLNGYDALKEVKY